MSRKKCTISKLFPKRLKTFIGKDLKITQGEFAKKVGISESYLSRILKGKVGPSAELITGLFFAYRQNLHYLLTGEDHLRKEINTIAEQEDIPYGKNKDEITELLTMTAEVLTSDTDYSQSLALNIHSFHQGMNDRQHIEERLTALEKKTSGKPRKAAKNAPKNAPAGDAIKKKAV